MPEATRYRLELGLASALFSALMLVGVALGGFVVHDFSRARASLSWPVVEAVILSAENGARSLRYAYSVGGRSYESQRLRFLSAGFARRPIAEQAPGDTIGVFVNPEEPAVAVVVPGGSGVIFAAILAIAGGFVFVGLGGLIRTIIAATRLDEVVAEPR